MPSLLIPHVANNPSKIQLSRISHVYHEHPDLSKWETFAQDFGFEVEAQVDGRIYYRGYGKDPYVYVAIKSASSEKEFGGGAFIAKTKEDFQKASALENAVIVDLSTAPGGGKMVSIPTPSGNRIHIVFGQKEREAAKIPVSKTEVHKGAFNTSLEKLRKGMTSI